MTDLNQKCGECGKKLRKIKADNDYNSWKRKYHKKCYFERQERLSFEAMMKDWREKNKL